jgi:hypothetical protein
MPRWLKISFKILGTLLLLLIVLVASLSIYISGHKSKILSLVTAELNKDLNGQLAVGSIKTSFLENFPKLSVKLLQVSLKDKQWTRHRHTLLQAGNVDVSVNTATLLKGHVVIEHVSINDAAVDLFTDSTGYSNTSVFKRRVSKDSSSANSSAKLNKFSLKNVTLSVDDRKAHKLFRFEINELQCKVDFLDTGWNAAVDMKVRAKSMAFNTLRGSFIKDKLVEGKLFGGYNRHSGNISVHSDDFNIGGDGFTIIARFGVNKKPADFSFHITASSLLWSHASALLTPNISMKLNMFDLSKPIAVDALIAGNFTSTEDPLLLVTAEVKDNLLTIPGSKISNCNFKGVFLNQRDKAKGFSDANSDIRLFNFSGKYKSLPFAIDTGSISDLDNPIATGNFRASFPVAELNGLFGSNAVKFSRGTAGMSLHYKADIVNYRINKPLVSGAIVLKNADINYVARHLYFKNTSLSLNFAGNDLLLNNIRLQSGRSVVYMRGRVNNFLNLYYNAPEKMLLNWQVTSPQLYLGEFIAFLNRAPAEPAAKSRNSGNIVNQLGVVLNKVRVNMHIRAANVHYSKFLATNTIADIAVDNGIIRLKNVSLQNAGGSLQINGLLKYNNFSVNALVNHVDVHHFFDSFDNFGLKAITADNLKGSLSAKAVVSGRIKNTGELVPLSVNGAVSLQLENAALINYRPLISVGKFAFPFRNLHNITIPRLDARFDIAGDKITIHPMQLNSSILNADVAGIYSLGSGTNITLDVPLRNPGKDAGITDTVKLAKRRNRGMVLHIRAADDASGKLKIGWNKDHKLL